MIWIAHVYIYLCAARHLAGDLRRCAPQGGLKIGAKAEAKSGAFSVRFWTPSGVLWGTFLDEFSFRIRVTF